MLKNFEGKEVDAFEQEMEHRIANLKTVIAGGHIEKEYVAGMKRGYELALGIYQGSSEDDMQLLRFIETNPGCTIQHIDEIAPLGLTGVKELLYSDEIVCKRVNGTPCYFIPSHAEHSSVKQLEKLADITRKTCELKMGEQSVDRKFFTLETAYQLGTMAIQFGLGLLCGYMVWCAA